MGLGVFESRLAKDAPGFARRYTRLRKSRGVISQHNFQPGYPVDARPARRVARLQGTPVGDFESMAARVVARLTGELVILQDDGSRASMPDICIEYTGRPPGYVEVWTDIDPKYAETMALLMKRQHQLPHVATAQDLLRDWQVTVGAAHLGRLEAEMEELLAHLEGAGEVFERVATLHALQSNPNPSVRRLLELGVVMLSSAPSDEGIIRLYPAGIHGPAIHTWEPVLAWIEQTLRGLADVRAKLAMTNARERHIFLGATYTSPSSVFFGLTTDVQTLPAEPPRLPPEITHLWMMNAQSGDRCVAWFPERGWFDAARCWATD